MPSLDYYIKKIPANAPPELRRLLIEEAKRKVEIDVFGEGFKRSPQGKPLEQGRGAPGNETAESVASFRCFCSHEPGFSEALKRKEADLARCVARRAAQATEVEF
jgi:hypothetical protein